MYGLLICFSCERLSESRTDKTCQHGQASWNLPVNVTSKVFSSHRGVIPQTSMVNHGMNGSRRDKIPVHLYDAL